MKVEIRSDSVILSGYVNVPARDSRPLPSPRGSFIEQITPKAFEKALCRADDVMLLFNHNENRNLGSVKNGNVEIFEDVIGLRAICTVTDEEVIQKAKNNELRGWSFGFVCREDRWVDEGSIQRRFVDELDIREISILDVTPAYYSTTIEARGEQGIIERRMDEMEVEVVQSVDDPNVSVAEEIIPTENVDIRNHDHYKHQIEIMKIKGGLY